MRVIICGAGQVGHSIATYLAREDNDITVIDHQAQLVAQIGDDLDLKGIVGHASDPEILSQAGASDCDMIIAVTHLDEINMVACQVAHSLFNVPKKIARVRRQTYLSPTWSNLFSRSHMPIDVIISPEVEVAEAIVQRLHIPGTTGVLSLADGKLFLVGVMCSQKCPVVNTQLKQFSGLFPDLQVQVAAIMRDSQIIIPGPNDQILVGDEVYIFTETSQIKRVLAVFGHEEQEARHIVIMGGGNIGHYLVNLLQKTHASTSIKIIERSAERARFLSEQLEGVVIINGDVLRQEVLEEANIAHVETLISVTNDDETNILGSLLAKKHGCGRVIALVNKSTYNPLITPLGIDTVVSPRASTVSKIMQHVRRGRIKSLFTLKDGIAEVIEAEVSETTSLANKHLDSMDLPSGVVMGPIVRGEKILFPSPDRVSKPGDHVVTLALREQASDVEKMFTVQVDLF